MAELLGMIVDTYVPFPAEDHPCHPGDALPKAHPRAATKKRAYVYGVELPLPTSAARVSRVC